MNRFKNFLLDAYSVKQGAKNHMKRYGLAVPIAIIGLMVFVTAYAQNGNDAAQATVFHHPAWSRVLAEAYGLPVEE